MARRIQRTYRRRVIYKAYLLRLRARLEQFARMYVHDMLQCRVDHRTRILANIRIQLWVRVQAAVRGYVTRRKCNRVRTVVRSLKAATVRVQSFWRTVQTISTATEHVSKLRRLKSETFSTCDTVHSVLTVMKGVSSKLYSVNDPRVGLKITGVLHRLGERETLTALHCTLLQ